MSTPVNYQCDVNNLPSGQIGRGVTTWEKSEPFTIPAGVSWPLDFTCTMPKCYSGKDSCNVTFNAYANSTSDITLDYMIGTNIIATTVCAPQGGWQSFDLANGNTGYVDSSWNNFAIHNRSSIDVTIAYFRILRIYKMCTLSDDANGSCCTANASCCAPEFVGPPIPSTLDSVQVDKPCNLEQCGGWSVTTVADTTSQGQLLSAGQSLDWSFDFSNCSSYNYEHGDKCLFNFNQMWAYNTSADNYVKLDMKINNQYLTSFYLSKNPGQSNAMFPSFDLMLNNTSYIDAGPNTVTLTNTSSNTDVQMTPSQGGINIYRVYQTGCPGGTCGSYTDAHSDHSDNPYSDYSDVPPGYCTVTVYATSEAYGPTNAGIYLDRNNVGYGSAQFQVEAGSQHNITFDTYANALVGPSVALDYVDDGGSGYNTNGGYINSDMTLTAYYTP